MRRVLLWIVRVIVGLLFIFSGLVKANDPLGLSYKMQEFFQALHVPSLSGIALGLSIVMITFEILLGVAVLVGYKMRFFSVLLLLLTLFFTFITAYAYLTGTVKECGCFGDCIKMTAAQSFWKDVILLALVLVIFFASRHIRPLFNAAGSILILLIGIFVAIGVQWYALNHLPIVDCLPYKVGNNINKLMQPPPGATPDQYKTVMIYEKNGQKKEFTEDNYPWQDTTWKFVNRKDILVKKGNAIPVIEDFAITDFAGNDSTQMILSNTDYSFLLLVKNVLYAGTGWNQKMQSLQRDCEKYHISIYGITASSQQSAEEFKQLHQLIFPFLQMDATVIKTIGRSNPCLILLKDGVIKGKWHYHDMPSEAEVIPGTNLIKLNH